MLSESFLNFLNSYEPDLNTESKSLAQTASKPGWLFLVMVRVGTTRKLHLTIIVAKIIATHEIIVIIWKKRFQKIYLKKCENILNMYEYIKETLRNLKRRIAIKTTNTLPYSLDWFMFIRDKSWLKKMKWINEVMRNYKVSLLK